MVAGPVVQLRHNTMSGDRVALVDGMESPGTRGTSGALFLPAEGHRLAVDINGEVALLQIALSDATTFKCAHVLRWWSWWWWWWWWWWRWWSWWSSSWLWLCGCGGGCSGGHGVCVLGDGEGEGGRAADSPFPQAQINAASPVLQLVVVLALVDISWAASMALNDVRVGRGRECARVTHARGAGGSVRSSVCATSCATRSLSPIWRRSDFVRCTKLVYLWA